MSAITDAFDELLDAQEEALGVRVNATVTGYATDKDCIPTADNSDLFQLGGGSGISGGYSVQMRKSDFNGVPTKGTPVTISCYTSESLQIVEDPNEAGGIYTLRVGDLAQNG